MKLAVLTGRILFSLIFITSGIGHFSEQTINYAVSEGVPLASFLVPASGVLVIAGGLSITLGWKARWGALLIVLFLVPVTLSMHHFWNMEDPLQRQIQMIMFMKNTSMLGGALIITYFGAGPYSIDARSLPA